MPAALRAGGFWHILICQQVSHHQVQWAPGEQTLTQISPRGGIDRIPMASYIVRTDGLALQIRKLRLKPIVSRRQAWVSPTPPVRLWAHRCPSLFGALSRCSVNTGRADGKEWIKHGWLHSKTHFLPVNFASSQRHRRPSDPRESGLPARLPAWWSVSSSCVGASPPCTVCQAPTDSSQQPALRHQYLNMRQVLGHANPRIPEEALQRDRRVRTIPSATSL